MSQAVFLDRDGTLIREMEYLRRADQVSLFPGTAQALRRLMDAGFDLVMVSNQSGVGRGYFTLDDIAKVHDHLCELLKKDGVSFRKIYIAPEHPDQPSRGRKPSPQFLFDARDEFGLDLAQSYMIGDKLIDLECGWNAGIGKSILVRTGYGAEWEQKFPEKVKSAVIVDDLPAAVQWILQQPR